MPALGMQQTALNRAAERLLAAAARSRVVRVKVPYSAASEPEVTSVCAFIRNPKVPDYERRPPNPKFPNRNSKISWSNKETTPYQSFLEVPALLEDDEQFKALRAIACASQPDGSQPLPEEDVNFARQVAEDARDVPGFEGPARSVQIKHALWRVQNARQFLPHFFEAFNVESGPSRTSSVFTRWLWRGATLPPQSAGPERLATLPGVPQIEAPSFVSDSNIDDSLGFLNAVEQFIFSVKISDLVFGMYKSEFNLITS